MTNAEKYKTAKERGEAFYRDNQIDVGAYVEPESVLNWLDLVAKAEEPLPCPFCTKGTLSMHTNVGVYAVWCRTCGYQSKQCRSEAEAISAHNRVARAVMDTKAKEVK